MLCQNEVNSSLVYSIKMFALKYTPVPTETISYWSAQIHYTCHMYTYYLNGTELLGRVKIIEVVLISCDGGKAVGSIMSPGAGAVTNNVRHLLHATSTSNT